MKLENSFEVGLPCGGTVHIFVDLAEREIVEGIAAAVREERPIALEMRVAGERIGEKRLVSDGAVRETGLVDDEALARVRSPAGLDLGPSSQEEIAVAVLAELVAWRHTRGELPVPPAEAVDAVCGMRVALAGADTVEHEGTTYAFCGPGCRARFEADPARYAGVGTA